MYEKVTDVFSDRDDYIVHYGRAWSQGSRGLMGRRNEYD